MERILTKEEIAELLSAVREGEIETASEPDQPVAQRTVTCLDLVRGHGPGHWRVANFDIILDALARNCSISLTNRMQHSVSVKRVDIESVEFDPFLQTLKGHGAIGIIRLDPLKGGGLFIFDASLSFSLLEIMLGGSSGSKSVVMGRPMTAIEMNVIKSVMADVCIDLQKAFRPLQKLETSMMKIEVNPRMVNIFAPETEVLVAKFNVSVDSLSGTMSLVIPYFSLEPLREKLKDGILSISSTRDKSWFAFLETELANMETSVAAQFGEVTLKIRDILNFQVGDIIDLNSDPKKPLRIMVEQKPKFLALAGVRNGKKAIRIAGRLEQGVNDGKK